MNHARRHSLSLMLWTGLLATTATGCGGGGLPVGRAGETDAAVPSDSAVPSGGRGSAGTGGESGGTSGVGGGISSSGGVGGPGGGGTTGLGGKGGTEGSSTGGTGGVAGYNGGGGSVGIAGQGGVAGSTGGSPGFAGRPGSGGYGGAIRPDAGIGDPDASTFPDADLTDVLFIRDADPYRPDEGFIGPFMCPPYGYVDAGYPSPYPCFQPPMLPPDPQRDQIANAFCGAIDRCCKGADRNYFPFPGFCAYQVGQNLIGVLGQMRASQAAGRTMIDQTAIDACVKKLQTDSCSGISPSVVYRSLEDVPGCQAIAVGKVAEGASCDRNFECVSGLYCDGATCRARPGAGQPCPDGQCAAGLYCRPFNPAPRCVEKKANGRLCDNPDECVSGSCSYNDQFNTSICGPPTSCMGK